MIVETTADEHVRVKYDKLGSPGQQANASVKANFQMVRQQGPQRSEMLQTPLGSLGI